MSIGEVKIDSQFYKKGKKYWSNVESNVNGMLGGFSHLSDPDINSSRRFLNQFFQTLNELKEDSSSDQVSRKVSRPRRRALDCGSGIGRVSKLLLSDYFDKIDLLDVTQAFLDESESYFGEEMFKSKIGNRFCTYIHQFKPKKNIKYDLIWCQWVTGHVSDQDLIHFLQKIKPLLTKNGLIVIKDNHTSVVAVDHDIKDSSMVRPLWLFKSIFDQAGLNIVSERRQYNFPKDIYPVRMFALVPKSEDL